VTQISATSSASIGIQRNLQTFNAAAERISSQPIGPNIIRDIMQMKQAKHGVMINAKVLVIADRMNGQLIDLFA
jgi:hypothetical protein